MDNKESPYFSTLKKDVGAYLETQLHIARLEAIEKGSRAVALFSWALVVSLILLFAIVFIFLAVGNAFGVLLGSLWAGYAIVAMIYLIMITALILLRERITTSIVNTLIRELTKEDREVNEQP